MRRSILALACFATTAALPSGLSQPVGATIAGGSRLFIAEKAGRVRTALVNDTSATTVLDLTAQVSAFGDHGLRAIEYNGGFLYVGYSVRDLRWNSTCTDSGAANNRTAANVTGCPLRSRLSRFAADAATGAVSASEEVLLEGPGTWCSQFTAGTLADIVTGADGDLYVSAGAGASDATVDYGQLGGDPCAVPGSGGWGGAFRSQLNGTLDGKIIRLNVTRAGNATATVVRGLHDPWRMAVGPAGALFVIDVGGRAGAAEAVRGPFSLAGEVNAGYPCYDGAAPDADFAALNSSICAGLRDVAVPFYSYRPAAGGGRAAISAIAYSRTTGRLYIGDYVLNRISSIDPASTAADRGLRVEMSGLLYPVDILDIPGVGLAYVDVAFGKIALVATVGPTSAAAPRAHVAAALVLAAAVAAALARGGDDDDADAAGGDRAAAA